VLTLPIRGVGLVQLPEEFDVRPGGGPLRVGWPHKERPRYYFNADHPSLRKYEVDNYMPLIAKYVLVPRTVNETRVNKLPTLIASDLKVLKD